MSDKQLQVEVDAHNKLNAAIKQYAPTLFRNAEKLVGKLVFKKDQSLRIDARDVLAIPEVNNRECQIFLDRSSSSFAITFKVSTWLPHPEEHRGDYCAYAQDTVYIATVDEGVVMGVGTFDPTNYPTDYTVEGVQEARKAYRVAEQAYEDTRSACDPFGVR